MCSRRVEPRLGCHAVGEVAEREVADEHGRAAREQVVDRTFARYRAGGQRDSPPVPGPGMIWHQGCACGLERRFVFGVRFVAATEQVSTR